MTMYYIGSSRTFNNVSSRVNTRTRPKNRFMAFYVSESMVKFSKVITKNQFHLNKLRKKCKRRKVYCLECGNSYTSVVQGSKIITDCPVCES